MRVRNEIVFLLNDQEIRLGAVAPSDTLLDHLRLDQRLRGTKEGCNEGDCGACTVLIGSVREERLSYETVNACIRLLPSVDRCHVVTIEHLRGDNGALHPVQQAMIDQHGSQCGFCTPGIVMSLYALWLERPRPSTLEIETALQGNLCRCTGYAPIVRAAQAAADLGLPDQDALVRAQDAIRAKLEALNNSERVEVECGGNRAILPASIDDLATVLEAEPQATVVAGATDVGLWVTKDFRAISPAVFIGHLDELQTIETDDTAIRIGAGASYSDCEETVLAAFPHLVDLWQRIGGWQVRNMGTVGGNVANGSPIGDTPPALIALGAELVLRSSKGRRTLPLEDFFLAYGKQDLQTGEFVEILRVPRARPQTLHAAYKISKRRDEDISSVCAAFAVDVEDGVVTAARLAFGGMAGTPKRAVHAEAALVGKAFSLATVQAAGAALSTDFQPLTDWRASATYRALVAQNLLRRFFIEHSGDATTTMLARAEAG